MENKYGCLNGRKILNLKTIFPEKNPFQIFVNLPNKWNLCKEVEFQDQGQHILVDIDLNFKDRMINYNFVFFAFYSMKKIIDL